jgi:hypothetical protein
LLVGSGSLLSLIPPLSKIGEVRIDQVLGTMSPQAGWRVLLREDSIHAATADTRQSCNLLFFVTGVKQFPDKLVTDDTIGMIPLTDLFQALCLERCGNRKRLSSKLLRRCFEDMSIATKKKFEGVS